MAGESSQEKTEQPTPHKLREARKRGEVAVSKDLTSAVSLGVAAAVILLQLDTISATFRSIAVNAFNQAGRQDLSNSLLLTIASDAARQAIWMCAPILLALFLIGLVIPFLQVGPLWSSEALKFKVDKLNPLSGLKRIFASLPPYIELLKNALKVVIVGLICWNVVAARFREVVMITTLPPIAIGELLTRILTSVVTQVVLFFVGLAILDIIYQRWQYLRNQRMTKDEIKREYKQQEGDPEHKQARRRLHEEINTGNMLQSVRQADVVVTNPDHLACALRFDPQREDAPRLLGKGRGYVAEKIKEIAREENIPILRNVSLAQALHQLELDDVIPEDLYAAVAEVLRWVEDVARSRGELPAWVPPPESESQDPRRD